MICPHCGHANEPGAKFCSSCGTALLTDDVTADLTALGERADGGTSALPDLAGLPPGAAIVLVRRGPNAGSTFAIEAEKVSAGRHPDSDIFLDDITVSRRHAVIERRGGDFLLRDVGSLNGTYVNHQRVDEGELHSGDEIQIGRYVLTFHVGGGEEGGG